MKSKKEKTARWVKSVFGNKANKPKKPVSKYQASYFHQIFCDSCGSKKVTAGFNIVKLEKAVRIDCDCAKCGEPVMGVQVSKDSLMTMLKIEEMTQKLK